MFKTYAEAVIQLTRRVERMHGALGSLLSRKLAEQELGPEDLALRSGVKLVTIYKLLQGSRDNPKAETIIRLAFAFDMEPADFVREWAEEAERLPQSNGAVDSRPLGRACPANYSYQTPTPSRGLALSAAGA